MTRATDLVSFARMSYVLEQTKQQQVLALGHLGWPVSRIAAAAQVDRATVTRYLRAASLPVRGRGPPSEATANAAISGRVVPTDPPANPAISPGVVSTDSAPSRAPRSSACEPRERIEAAVRLGRNAMAGRCSNGSGRVRSPPGTADDVEPHLRNPCAIVGVQVGGIAQVSEP